MQGITRVSTEARQDIGPLWGGLLIGAFSLATLATAATTGLRPPSDSMSDMAVIFAPWTAPEAVLRRATEAGARIVGFGALPFVAFVVPEGPDYVSRVERSGAWLVALADRLPGCFGRAREAHR